MVRQETRNAKDQDVHLGVLDGYNYDGFSLREREPGNKTPTIIRVLVNRIQDRIQATGYTQLSATP